MRMCEYSFCCQTTPSRSPGHPPEVASTPAPALPAPARPQATGKGPSSGPAPAPATRPRPPARDHPSAGPGHRPPAPGHRQASIGPAPATGKGPSIGPAPATRPPQATRKGWPYYIRPAGPMSCIVGPPLAGGLGSARVAWGRPGWPVQPGGLWPGRVTCATGWPAPGGWPLAGGLRRARLACMGGLRWGRACARGVLRFAKSHAQGGAGFGLGLLAPVRGDAAEKAVNNPFIATDGDGDASFSQFLTVQLTFVAQGVVLGGDDEGGGQAAQVARQQGRGQRVRLILFAIQVMVREPDHVVFRQKVAGGVLFDRDRVHPEIGGGIDQQLEDKVRASPISRHLGHNGSEIAARAIAADGNVRSVHVQLRRVLRHPLRRRIAIFRRGREFVFGREPVIDGDHDATRSICQAAADAIVCVQVADHPAAAMKKDQRRERPIALRRVDATGYLTRRAGNGAVLDAGNLLRLNVFHRELHCYSHPYLLGRQRMDRGHIHCRHLIETFANSMQQSNVLSQGQVGEFRIVKSMGFTRPPQMVHYGQGWYFCRLTYAVPAGMMCVQERRDKAFPVLL